MYIKKVSSRQNLLIFGKLKLNPLFFRRICIHAKAVIIPCCAKSVCCDFR